MYPQKPNIPLQALDRYMPTVGAISGLHCQIGASIGAILPVVMVGKDHSGEAGQLTLASRGSEHA